MSDDIHAAAPISYATSQTVAAYLPGGGEDHDRFAALLRGIAVNPYARRALLAALNHDNCVPRFDYESAGHRVFQERARAERAEQERDELRARVEVLATNAANGGYTVTAGEIREAVSGGRR